MSYMKPDPVVGMSVTWARLDDVRPNGRLYLQRTLISEYGRGQMSVVSVKSLSKVTLSMNGKLLRENWWTKFYCPPMGWQGPEVMVDWEYLRPA